MSSVGIFGNPKTRLAGQLADRLAQLCARRGREVFLEEPFVSAAGVSLKAEEVAARCELALVLGGDGTFIRVVRTLGERQVPLFGVNLGRLGYLTEFTVDEAPQELERVLRGQFTTQLRSRLRVRLIRSGETAFDGMALNDAVISALGMNRLIELRALLNNQLVAIYRADGLIVSTPTGSTAYSLSAGGPILLPETAALVLSPICPHTLSMRPLVVPQESLIEISIDKFADGVHVSLDGQRAEVIQPGDRLLMGKADHGILLVEPQRNTFEILRAKLHWGEN
jgi:NAD+ kinase